MEIYVLHDYVRLKNYSLKPLFHIEHKQLRAHDFSFLISEMWKKEGFLKTQIINTFHSGTLEKTDDFSQRATGEISLQSRQLIGE